MQSLIAFGTAPWRASPFGIWTSRRITSITQAEILYGILRLPSGKRRKAIELAAEAMFEEDFDGRILPFGSDAAFPYAQITADRRKRRQPISHFDAQIAAISRASGATVGTRNAADFIHCGIEVVNPWDQDARLYFD